MLTARPMKKPKKYVNTSPAPRLAPITNSCLFSIGLSVLSMHYIETSCFMNLFPVLGRNWITLLYFLDTSLPMKVHCPDCKGIAELADDFSFVKCPNCAFDMTYGEYVKYIAYKDVRYRDVLSDYK